MANLLQRIFILEAVLARGAEQPGEREELERLRQLLRLEQREARNA